MKPEDHNLVEITEAEYGVAIDIKYATNDNFTGQPVYSRPACYLLNEAAEKLRKAIDIAAKLGYAIRIFDAYRPTEAQQKLWDHTPDPDFLAPPDKGSAHSRGVAIDITLMDGDGNDIDMGTEFDAFTPLSFHGVTEGISIEAQKNRLVLLGIMSAAGWDFYKNEWWHYQLFNARATYKLISDKEAGTKMMG